MNDLSTMHETKEQSTQKTTDFSWRGRITAIMLTLLGHTNDTNITDKQPPPPHRNPLGQN
jgi:hypothetical protein